MYIVIRKFNNIRSVKEAARRAESGIGQILKQSDGFRGYYVFGTGDGIAGSVTLFDSEDAATAANEKAMMDRFVRASPISSTVNPRSPPRKSSPQSCPERAGLLPDGLRRARPTLCVFLADIQKLYALDLEGDRFCRLLGAE